jgi:virginiamycin A acetyltransferase
MLPILEAIGRLLAQPLVLAWRLRLVSYPTAGQILSLIPGDVGMLVRRGWYRSTLASCGRGLTVEFGTVLQAPDSRLGNDCYFAELIRVGLVDIGDDCMASDGVQILSGMHHYGVNRSEFPMRSQPGQHRRVHVGHDVWLGTSAVVGADVASHSVVAAGAVVTRPFDEWQILGGVPAKPIGERPPPAP